MLSFGEIDEIEHIGCGAESVAKLFDAHTDIDHEERGICAGRKPDESQTGERHAPGHRHHPSSQTAAAYQNATDYAARKKADDADRAVGETDLCGR